MKFTNVKQQRIHPEDSKEMQHLADKWGITLRQLNEAIVDTGSIDVKKLKMHLKEKGVIQIPFIAWLNSIRQDLQNSRKLKFYLKK
jgi:hypothetical protein